MAETQSESKAKKKKRIKDSVTIRVSRETRDKINGYAESMQLSVRAYMDGLFRGKSEENT